MTPTAVLLRSRQQLVLRALVEDVVDHLDRVHQPAAHQLDRRLGLVIVDRDSERADLSLVLQAAHLIQPVALAEPVGGPDVELLHVDVVSAEPAQALLGALAHVLGGEALVHRGARRGPASAC